MTDSYSRPSPDALLAQLRQAAYGSTGSTPAGKGHMPPHQPERGVLKIFFGYAAGVGKTYSMLRAAHAAQEQGHKVVVGYVEPHPRPQTAALLAGLAVVPPLRLSYRQITLSELDVDAVIARKPEIALVDELAHSNAGGCRNRKRYQDVEELLQAGVSVWTTVNVQHLESLNDVVAALTGVVVRERIPDSVFDGADQVELVDLEPDELMARLREGKIYSEAQVQRALGHFFVPANLIALREIALRRMADRVNRRAVSAASGSTPATQIKEHILICLSGAPSNARVIRTAARMVEAFRADFTALFVQNSYPRPGDTKNTTLRDNLKLAEDLGAVIVTLQGDDIPAQIAEYARMSGVSKIVVGRSPAGGWLLRKGKTLVERLAELAPEMETYIIPDAAPAGRVSAQPSPMHAMLRALLGAAPRSWRQWAATGAIMAVCSVAGLLMFSVGMPNGGIAGLYMLGVLGVSILTAGPWYGVTASVSGVALFDFLFVEPRFSFTVYDMDYVGLFSAMLLVSTATSAITGRARAQAHKSTIRALHTELLLGNSRRLQKASDETAILQEAARQFGTLLGCGATIYPVHQGSLATQPCFAYKPDKPQQPTTAALATTGLAATGLAVTRGGPCSDSPKDELGVAQWVAKNNRPAGAGTDSLPGSRHCFIPISSQSDVLAVAELAILPGQHAPLADATSKNLVLALAGECALALEKERLTQANASIAVRAQQEKLRADVLRSISHDLRTPLTGICGNAAILASPRGAGSAERNAALAATIEEEARYLVGMVENLLALTRLEQQNFSLRLEPELLEDIIGEAVQIMARRAARHDLHAEIPETLLMARMDARLMVQVLVNLLDNAVKHTPEGTAIRVRARADGPWVRLEVADNGPGICEQEQAGIFDMFHSAAIKKGDGRRGMGLGLALCRSIVQAHGGQIAVHANMPQGAVFSLTLPRHDETQILPSL